jgi:hypothetical protein
MVLRSTAICCRAPRPCDRRPSARHDDAGAPCPASPPIRGRATCATIPAGPVSTESAPPLLRPSRNYRSSPWRRSCSSPSSPLRTGTPAATRRLGCGRPSGDARSYRYSSSDTVDGRAGYGAGADRRSDAWPATCRRARPTAGVRSLAAPFATITLRTLPGKHHIFLTQNSACLAAIQFYVATLQSNALGS